MKKITRSFKRLFLLSNVVIIIFLICIVFLLIKKDYFHMTLSLGSFVVILYSKFQWHKAYKEFIEKFN
ncbi:MAG: hypothetical protein E6902_01685 [Paeniclostridium sordellii]|nr:hypothetical protein [Paeniclostridium sordellii]